MKTFKTNTAVRFIQPPIEGVILKGRLSDSGDTVDYSIAYRLPNGDWGTREFSSENLEALEGDDQTRVTATHDEFIALTKQQGLEDEAAARLHDAQPADKPVTLEPEAIAAEVAVIAQENAAAVEGEVKQ